MGHMEVIMEPVEFIPHTDVPLAVIMHMIHPTGSVFDIYKRILAIGDEQNPVIHSFEMSLN